jgi:hypothetical protein
MEFAPQIESTSALTTVERPRRFWPIEQYDLGS